MKIFKVSLIITIFLLAGIVQCKTKEKIVIVPIGKVDRSIITNLCKELQGKFKADVEIGTPLKRPIYAYNPEKGSFFATPILQRLYPAIKGNNKLVGIINENLYNENPIFLGVAQRFGRISLISLKNLKDDLSKERYREKILITLMCSVAIHEIAHLYGLDHCGHEECIMYETCIISTKGYIVNTDFCPVCRALLDRRMLGLSRAIEKYK